MSQEPNSTPADGTGTAVTGAGDSQDGRMAAGENAQTLTTRQGHPLTNNQNTRTVGNRGPATLENYQFIEKISHFDRERVPERVVHARGAGAHGTFEAYGTVGGEQVNDVLVEAGPRLAGAFAQAGLVDEYHLFLAPRFLGSSARPLLDWPLVHLAEAPQLEILSVTPVGADLHLIARPARDT